MFKRTKLSTSLMIAFGGGIAVSTLPAIGQVTITGTSIKRIEASGALPVQTLTRTDIERTGVQTTEQLLQTISAMSSSGQTQTSTGVGLSTYGTVGVSLRGLGEERTLVLVNGQRLAAFAGGGGATVNVNNIPLAAIERVEVLKDGASAVYGSDAVAGVVNFILQKNFQGYEISGTLGTPTESGGGEQYQANIVAGWGDQTKDGWNLTVSGQWQKNEDLFGRSRDYSKSSIKEPYYISGATGQGNIQGIWIPGVGPGPGYVAGGQGAGYGNPMAVGDRCPEIGMARQTQFTNTTVGNVTRSFPYCEYDPGSAVGLLGQSEIYSLTGNLTVNLGQSAQFFADALWSRSEVKITYQPSPLRTSFLETDEEFDNQGVDRVLLLRPTNPAYQIAADYLNSVGLGALVGQPLGVMARVFDFGPRTNVDTSTQTRIIGGVRGEVLEQSYNVLVGWNQNKLEGTVTDGYFSQVGYARATQDPASDWNPWSLTQSQAFQNAIASSKYVGSTLDATAKSWNAEATLSGDVIKLPAGTMQYAAGYQYRKEQLEQSPSAALFSGDIAGLGGAEKPIDADRTVNALFAELNIPVIKDLDVNLAIRWDDYSDFGSTTNWKGNFRWVPTQQLLVRGSYGTGFRAPTLSDLYDPQVLQTSTQFTDPVTGQTDLQVNDLNGGNPDLQPEESTQWSLGLIFQPLPTLSIGIDYFNIEVDDVISQPSTQEIVTQNAAGDPSYAGLVIRDPVTNEIISTKTILANTGKMKVDGFDLDARYRETLGPGVLSVNLQGTYYMTFDQTSPGGFTSQKVATIIGSDCSPVISSTRDLDGYGVIPRYKQYVTVNWTQGDWSTTVGNQFTTGYWSGCDLNDNPVRVPSMTFWDLIVAYSGFKNAVISLGARNVFDKQPATFVPVSNQFQSGYDASQYDPRGRFVFITGSFKF